MKQYLHVAIQSVLVPILCICTTTAAAQESGNVERTDARASAIANSLSQKMESPYCPGKSLEMCPSSGASRIRREIYSFAKQGLPESRIRKKIIEEYGDQVRLKNPTRSDNTTLFILLILVVIGCAGLILYLYRSSSSDQNRARNEDDSIDRPEDQLLVEELRDEYR